MANILIVDDDNEAGDLLADLLRDEGHDVWVARNGHEGLSRLESREPDLVLLDVEMPVLSGPEMAYEMFLHDLGMENIPVVLVSGVLNLGHVAASVGTPYFAAKPYDLQRLLGLVGEALIDRVPPRPQSLHRDAQAPR